MRLPLKQVLLDPRTRGADPLFPNAAQLGAAVAEADSTHFSDPRKTAVLLGFVLRKERLCSPDLRSAILGATKTRAASLSARERADLVRAVETAITTQNASLTEPKSPPDDDQFDELLERAEQAAEHFIITPLSAEQAKNIERADALNQILLERLGIVPMSKEKPATRYRFLLPSEEGAAKFWDGLVEKATTAAERAREKPNHVATRIAELNRTGFLEAFVVPSYVCGFPIVVFNPDPTEVGESAAFSFSHHPNNTIDAIQWDYGSLRAWTLNVHQAFEPRERKEDVPSAPGERNKFYGYHHRFTRKSGEST